MMSESGRCYTCDSRYCWDGCHADDPGYLYVVGRGWLPTAEAEAAARAYPAAEVDSLTRPGPRGGSKTTTHRAGNVSVTLDEVPGHADVIWVSEGFGGEAARIETWAGAGRAVANAAFKTAKRGGDWAHAYVAGVFTDRDPYEAMTLANVAGGKCPDGCCGAGMDVPHTAHTEAIETALRSQMAAR